MDSAATLRPPYEYHRDNMSAPIVWKKHNDHCLPHFHSSIELVWVRSGALHALLDGRPYDVSAGQLLIVSGYVVHTYQSLQENEVTLHIVPLSFVPALQKLLLDHAFSSPVYDLCQDAQALTVWQLINDGWQEFGAETQMGLCYALLGLLIDRVGLTAVRTDARKGLIRDVLIYLQNNYQSHTDMTLLAQRFGYSKSRFSHLFNETLGYSPTAFLNALRCQHAAHELLESDRTMLEIALSAGFECPRTFYRVFKQYYGMTPTQYVRAHSEKG